MSNIIFAIDFDGTIVGHAYPEIGREAPNCFRVLKALQNQGYRLILYTMRSGNELQEAIDYCASKDLFFWGINENPEQENWTTSPKVYATHYIDDAAIGCPTIFDTATNRPMVNWREVEAILKRRGLLI